KKGFLFDVRQDFVHPGITLRIEQIGVRLNGKMTIDIVVSVQRQAELLQLRGAFGQCRGGPDLLNGGNEQGEQNGDDSDDDEKLNEGEGFSHGSRSPQSSA